MKKPQEAAAALLAAKHYSSPEHLLAAEQARTQLRAAVEARLEALQNSERLDRQPQRARPPPWSGCARTLQAAARQPPPLRKQGKPPPGNGPAGLQHARCRRVCRRQPRSKRSSLPSKPCSGCSTMTGCRRSKPPQTSSWPLSHSKQRALCAHFEEAKRQLAADPALALRLLHAEIRRHAAAKQEARGILARRDELLLAITSCRTPITRAGRCKSNRSFEEAGLANEAQYELALEHRRVCRSLSLSCRSLTLELTAGMSEERVAELEKLFDDYDEEAASGAAIGIANGVKSLEQQKRELLEQRGRLRQSLD